MRQCYGLEHRIQLIPQSKEIYDQILKYAKDNEIDYDEILHYPYRHKEGT